MADSQSTNPLNQSGTSSELQQPSPSKPANDSPASKPEVIFTVDDMATSEFSENMNGIQTFSIPISLQSDE